MSFFYTNKSNSFTDNVLFSSTDQNLQQSVFALQVLQTNMSEMKISLVTGGTGVVGSAIQYISETEEKRPDEQWIFVNSKDADLRFVN